MPIVKVDDMTADQINWKLAQLADHHWRYPWLLADEGWRGWRSMETAWGAWHPEPTDGDNLAQLCREAGIAVMTRDFDTDEWIVVLKDVQSDEKLTPSKHADLAVAVCRAALKRKVKSNTVVLPDDAKWE